MKFKDTCLYYAITHMWDDYKNRCLYLKILTAPFYIIALFIGVFFSMVIDFFYFSFS